MGFVLCPRDQLAGVTAVGEDVLDKREAPPRLLQDAFCSVAILNIGTVDLDREQPTVGVGQNVPLAPVDAFSSVVALGSSF